MLKFWTPLTVAVGRPLTSGIEVPDAYVHVRKFNLNMSAMECRVHFSVYKDKAAYTAGTYAPIKNLPVPLDQGYFKFREDTPIDIYTYVISTHIVPGMDEQSVINKLKAFINFLLGSSNVTWDP